MNTTKAKKTIDAFIDKWQGKADIGNDAFWYECIYTYRSTGQYRLTLPWIDAPETRAYATEFLACKRPCGDCCHFGLESISYADAVRIAEGAGIPWGQLSQVCTLIRKDGQDLFWAIKGIPCPFLKDELCTIYEHRPQVCRDYPILRPTLEDGVDKLAVSVRCDSGANVGREMIRLHLQVAGGRLTPNLQVI